MLDNVSIGVILIVVGLIICQQAIEVSATRHMPAFFIGIFCLIFDWATLNTSASHPHAWPSVAPHADAFRSERPH